MPKFRRRNVGTRAARLLFDLHPGPWHISQVRGNTAATDFWRRAIAGPFAEHTDDQGTIIQSFFVE